MVTEAIVFDLDGVLIDSEQLWDKARRQVVAESGGRWRQEATGAMQGMSSAEWSEYMSTTLEVPLSAGDISDLVVRRLLDLYGQELPLLPAATEAVRRMSRWPLGLASSSNREVIDRVLEVAGLGDAFEVTVSSEEVPRGKPHPDVYLEVSHRLGRPPHRLMAVEDSANGIRSAVAAGLTVVAVPNRRYPPPPDVLETTAAVLDDLAGLTADLVDRLDRKATDRRLDEQEDESFPASDPHADWAGPPE